MTLAAVLSGAGVAYWQYSQISDTQGRISALEGKLKDEKKIAEELTSTEQKLAESLTKVNHLEKGVPQIAYVPTLLTELESVGKRSGIAVTGVRPMPPKAEPKKDGSGNVEKKPYEELDIEVKGRGSYKSVQRFLTALQAFPKIVAVRTTGLAPKREDSRGNAISLDVTIELRSYLFPPVETGQQPGPTSKPVTKGVNKNGVG